MPLLKEKRVTIHAVNSPVEKVLSLLFAGKDIKYRVVDNIILLSKNDPIPAKKTTLIQIIKGKVVDKESHSPLANVSITVINVPALNGAITDSNGLFSLKIP